MDTHDEAPRGNSVVGGVKGLYGDKARRGTQVLNRLATITGYACACTPYTDHPGTGKAWDQDNLQDGRLAGLRDAGTEFSNRPNMGSLGDYEKVGPHREYHLDNWTPPETKPAVVLDPFGGTGTTAMVARALGRTGISVDLSHDYSRLAKWRIFESGHAGKTMGRTNKERQGNLI